MLHTAIYTYTPPERYSFKLYSVRLFITNVILKIIAGVVQW